MKNILIGAAALWTVSVATSAIFGEPAIAVPATAAILLIGLAWLPFGAVRWAYRELLPKARWAWLGINATIIVFAAPIMTTELLIGSLLVINGSAWLAFAFSLRVVVWRTRREVESVNGA